MSKMGCCHINRLTSEHAGSPLHSHYGNCFGMEYQVNSYFLVICQTTTTIKIEAPNLDEGIVHERPRLIGNTWNASAVYTLHGIWSELLLLQRSSTNTTNTRLLLQTPGYSCRKVHGLISTTISLALLEKEPQKLQSRQWPTTFILCVRTTMCVCVLQTPSTSWQLSGILSGLGSCEL